MLRSLFAGISGLRTNQTMLDVTGNNIANANTTGFKSSTTVFSDTLSQMLTAAAAPGENGGTNPIQVGLGVQVASVTQNFGQGSTQMTGRVTDMMIQGDGFFVVQDGDQELYTRAGAFTFDRDRTLVSPSGFRVQGYQLNADGSRGPLGNVVLPEQNAGGAALQSYTIGPDGTVRGVFADGSQSNLFRLAVADFANVGGLEKVGDSNYRVSANSGPVELGVAGEGARGDLVTGALEMSNVDLAAEFTNLILAQRGFQASSRVITTSDQVLEELVNIKR